jgi:hypothetical protein
MEIRALLQPWRRRASEGEMGRPADRDGSPGDELKARREEIARMEERALREAESLAVQRQQVTPELIQLRQMENQRLAIEKWDGKLPSVAGGAIPFINVNSAK